MATQIQLRRDTAANWALNNPILAEGEIGIETDGLGTSTVLKKIGNGVNNWSDLPYESTGGGGGEPSDGDKGDITVSLSGSQWDINSEVVNNDKLSQMAANTIKGRQSVIGAPQDLAPSQVRSIINVEDGSQVNTINSSIIGEPTGSDVVLNVVSLTQAEYDAGTPVSTTFYIITDA